MTEEEPVIVAKLCCYESVGTHRVTIPKKIIKDLQLKHGDIIKLKISVLHRFDNSAASVAAKTDYDYLN